MGRSEGVKGRARFFFIPSFGGDRHSAEDTYGTLTSERVHQPVHTRYASAAPAIYRMGTQPRPSTTPPAHSPTIAR